MSASLTRFIADQSGVTAIEYGAIAAFVGLIIIGATGDIGLHARSVFRFVAWVLGPRLRQLQH